MGWRWQQHLLLNGRYWQLVVLMIMIYLSKMDGLFAQIVTGGQGTIEHNNGLLWTWQRQEGQTARYTLFATDSGSVSYSFTSKLKNLTGSLIWNLGIGERLDRFINLNSSYAYQHILGIHTFSLSMGVAGDLNYGRGGANSLEEQFALAGANAANQASSLTYRPNYVANIGDRILLTKSLIANVNSAYQLAETHIDGQYINRSDLQSSSASLQKLYKRSTLQANASLSKSQNESKNSAASGLFDSEQTTVDAQVTANISLSGPTSVLIGWQELQSKATASTLRRLSGPQIGINYDDKGIVTAGFNLRLLTDSFAATEQTQLFGDARLNVTNSSRFSWGVSHNKDIDLGSRFRLFVSNNILTNDVLQESTTTSMNSNYRIRRHTLSLSVSKNQSEFIASRSEFVEFRSAYGYATTQRSELSLSMAHRENRFTAVDVNSQLQTKSQIVELSFQQLLRGGFDPMFGRNFIRTSINMQRFEEQNLLLDLERLTILLAIGQSSQFK